MQWVFFNLFIWSHCIITIDNPSFLNSFIGIIRQLKHLILLISFSNIFLRFYLSLAIKYWFSLGFISQSTGLLTLCVLSSYFYSHICLYSLFYTNNIAKTSWLYFYSDVPNPHQDQLNSNAKLKTIINSNTALQSFLTQNPESVETTFFTGNLYLFKIL